MISISLLGAFLSLPTHAKENDWDQEKAKKMVGLIQKVENAGEPWDQVKWETEQEKAIQIARNLNKPICVFVFVNKGGPKEAPC